MNEQFLRERLERLLRRQRSLELWRNLALCWVIAAAVATLLVLLARSGAWSSPLTLPVVAALAAAAATALVIRQFQRPLNLHQAAQQVEKAHPELNGVLLTAVQQILAPHPSAGYLEHRVMQEATRRSQEADWGHLVPPSRLALVHGAHLAALGCLTLALLALRVDFVGGPMDHGAWVAADGVAITPGDATIERGESLVVLARFGRSLPAAVTLVTHEDAAPARTIPLVKSLADPVFGGSVPDVARDFTYHLEFRGRRTREFKVAVFEHPRLVRADVDLTFPTYTKLPPKHIEDTRRVSAVEGTTLAYALQLNKPVKAAKLIARDQAKTEIPLVVSPDKAVASLAHFAPPKSATYDLQLVDADGRANKNATPFIIDVQPNRPPEIKVASPRGDVRPSALEEIAFAGTVWDDFGAPAYGLSYTLAGGETKNLELGRDAGAKEKREFNYTLRLEDLGAKPDDLVSWYVWADDVGPDGKVRRTKGDLYFAEVRPFDEVFRESQDMQSSDSQQSQQGQQGNQRRRLTELEKQIINATWKLQRDGGGARYPDDAKVVAESQQQAMEQAIEQAGNARAPRETALWKDATQQMDKALDKLKDAAKTPGPLADALPAEQAAYQALLKLQARETAVTRGRRGGGGGGGQMNQRQIDQLDLQQAENRYETQRQARAPQQSQQRTEDLAVMNRLQELARRQQDLNERLKELQTALQEAKTDQQREEARRRLKRLEEEQRQMLADADEIRQRMDRADNQSRMSPERQQLDQTRDDLQKAADAAADGSVAQALASGTRAQRQLQQIRDDLRKENSSQFADDLRDMRGEARELARQQEELGRKLEATDQSGTQRKSLGESGDREKLADELAQQKERMNKLVDRAQQISEQAENTEPLVSKELYDSIRKVSQDDTNAIKQAREDLLTSGMMSRDLLDRLKPDADGNGKVLDLARDMLREGYLPQARRAGQRAGEEIEDLRRGVERAAESVLGDDAEQLKLAQSELDQLTDQLRREINDAKNGTGAQAGQTARDNNGKAGGARPGERQPGAAPTPGDAAGDQLAANDAPAGNRADPSASNGAARGGADRRQANANEQKGGGQNTGDQPGEPNAASPSPGGRQGGGRGQLANNGRNGQARNARTGGRGTLSLDNVMNGGARGGANGGGGGGGAFTNDGVWMGGNWDGRGWDGGPITGGDFRNWTDRLSDVEQLVDTPELRNALAAARERARLLRRDFTQDRKKPDWAVVELQIVKPLVEVRDRVAEELARRDSKESLAPIDRDPVPNRFAESVRRYYEELGKDEKAATVK